ncbi:hypothetical protein HDV05_001924 [Chytridiales sp. JEL 0842]|nr:hypothetical protein HDV05_001924 [Chytridiales sp. JEL 0842]
MLTVVSTGDDGECSLIRQKFIKSCVASYVRRSIADKDTRREICKTLKKGDPHIQPGFAAVVIIDISGYSSVTSNLSTLGKISSEIITTTVSDYMSKIIKLVTAYSGDVVKFLGDAALVVFPQLNDGEPTSSCVERAVMCCLSVLNKFSTITIDLGRAIDENHRLSTTEKTIKLDIHVALSAGTISHVILGIVEERMDYCVHGCLEEIGNVLCAAQGGELGLSENTFTYLSNNVRYHCRKVANLQPAGHSIIPQRAVNALFDSLFRALHADQRPTKNTGFPIPGGIAEMDEQIQLPKIDCEPPEDPEPEDDANSEFQMLQKFINQSLLRKAVYSSSETRSRRASHYSGDRKMSVRPISEVIFTSEFRTVSVVFVKLLNDFNPKVAQQAMSAFVNILKKWEGVFQQFAIDDKGQSMMACFGLPPWSHEKDALNALKSAVEFAHYASRKKSFGNISVSVATGELLYSKLGDLERSDASLLGDVVNVAARLLSLGNSESVVKCDRATYLATKEDFFHKDLGNHTVKGKAEPIRVWGVRSKATNVTNIDNNQQSHVTTQSFGYVTERSTLNNLIERWAMDSIKTQVVIEGKSGVGLSQASEIKRVTSYFAIQNLMQFLLKRHAESSPLERADTRNQKGSLLIPLTRQSSISKKDRSHSIILQISQGLLPIPTRSGDSILEAPSNPFNILIQNFLRSMEENPLLAPLFSDILPMIGLSDNEFTKGLDSATRCAMLQSCLIRLVEKSLEFEPFIIVFDDCQWMDESSLDFVLNLAKSECGSFIVMFTRPIEESKNETLIKVAHMNESIHMPLKGLTLDDTREFLNYKLGNRSSFKSIDEDVIKNIYGKSEGFPLALDTISEALKSHFDQVFSVDDGTLRFNGASGLEFVNKVSTVSSATLLEFDRLSSQYQEILRKASVLGQYFTLNDLSIFLEAEPSVEEIEHIIKTNDVHQYLIRHHRDGDDDEYQIAYYFRHIQIMNCIYESQSYNERSEMHGKVGELFEGRLTDESSRDAILPIIAFHYCKSSQHHDKQIQYLEELGILQFRKSHFKECIRNLQALLEIVNENPSIINDNPRKAHWLSILAMANVEAKNVYIRPYCEEALSLVNGSWPDNAKAAKLAMIKAVLKMLSMYSRTKGGTRPSKTILSTMSSALRGKKDKEVMDPRLHETLLFAFKSLFRHGIFTGAFGREYMGLCLFSMCNLLIGNAHRDQVSWIGILTLTAFGTSWSFLPLSKMLFRQALRLESKLPPNTPFQHHMYAAQLHYEKAELKEAERALLLFKKYSDDRGDLSQSLYVYSVLQCIDFWRGNFFLRDKECKEILKEEALYKIAVQFGLTRVYLLTRKRSESEKYLAAYIESYKSMPQRNLSDLGFIFPALFHAYKDGDWNLAIEKFKEVANIVKTLEIFYTFAVEVMTMTPIVAFMFGFCLSVGTNDDSFHRLSETQHKEILECMKVCRDKCKWFAISKKMKHIEWPYILSEAAVSFWMNKPKDAKKMLLRALEKRNDLVALFKEQRMTHAAIMMPLALIVDGQDEGLRLRYYNEVSELFASFRADYMKQQSEVGSDVGIEGLKSRESVASKKSESENVNNPSYPNDTDDPPTDEEPEEDQDPEDNQRLTAAQSLLVSLASSEKLASGALSAATQVLKDEQDATSGTTSAEEKVYEDINNALNHLTQSAIIPGSDDTIARIRDEYASLHKMFVKAHKNELALAKKCKEMASEFAANTAKVQAALKMAQADRMTIAGLKKEVKTAWKMVEVETEKESRAKEAVTRLKMEVDGLKRKFNVETSMPLADMSVGRGGGAVNKLLETQMEQEGLIAKLNKDKEVLQEQLEYAKADIRVLSSQTGDLQSRIESLIQERDHIQANMDSIKELLSTKKADSERDRKVREKLEATAKTQLEALKFKEAEIGTKNSELKLLRENTVKLEIQLKEERLKSEKESKERESLAARLGQLTQDYEESVMQNSRLVRQSQNQAEELKGWEEELSQFKEELKGHAKLKEKMMKRVKALEDLKLQAETDRDHYKGVNYRLTHEQDALRRDLDLAQKTVESLTRDRDIAQKNFVKATGATQKQHTAVKLAEQGKRNLEQEIMSYKEEAAKMRKLIYSLEKDRDLHINESNRIQQEMNSKEEELKLKEMLIFDSRKKISDLERKLKEQQSLYENVRADRNIYSKNLIESQDEITEMRRKLKIINHQIDQLKEEIAVKDAELVKENFENTKLEKEKEGLSAQIARLQKQYEEALENIQNHQAEENKLRYIITEADTERIRHRKDFDSIVHERDVLGTQLIRRNSEISLLLEKIKILTSTLNKGEIQFRERIEDIRVLKLEIKKLRREKALLQTETQNVDTLRNEIFGLQRDLLKERTRVKVLEEELESPMNIHRWRRLQGSDPTTYELITKIQTLQKRLIAKTEEVFEKELLIAQKEKLYVEVKQILQRQPGPEVLEELRAVKDAARSKTRECKSLASELNMYHSQLNSSQYEITRLHQDLQDLKKKYYDLKKREREKKLLGRLITFGGEKNPGESGYRALLDAATQGQGKMGGALVPRSLAATTGGKGAPTGTLRTAGAAHAPINTPAGIMGGSKTEKEGALPPLLQQGKGSKPPSPQGGPVVEGGGTTTVVA